MQVETLSASVVKDLFLLTWKDTGDSSIGFANATYNMYIVIYIWKMLMLQKISTAK